MVSYLVLCRSLTHAQRTAHVLERVGIKNHVTRTPRSITADGCGYCVRLNGSKLEAALRLLRDAGLDPKQVYMYDETGKYSEVPL